MGVGRRKQPQLTTPLTFVILAKITNVSTMTITPAESLIMDALWARHPLTVEEILAVVAAPAAIADPISVAP